MQGGAEVTPGMQVTCRDGHRIGSVKEMLPGGRYFRVDCRFAPDLYVPLDAVHDTSGGEVHLKVTHIESTNLGWEAKPS
jgi:hypothetical protein